MKRALYNQPDATPCGSTDNRKRNKTASLLHPFKNGAGKLLLTLFLLMTSITTWAQTGTTVANCYVFNNGTYGYLYNKNGTLASSTTFTPQSVWIASGAMGTTNRTLQSYSNRAQYLVGSAGNGDAVSIGNSSSVWQTRDGYLATRGNYYSYYLQTNDGTAFTTRRSGYNQRYTPVAISTTQYPVSNNATAPIISATISSGNNGVRLSHTNLSGSYRIAYDHFVVSGTNHYWYDGSDHNTAPQQTTFNNSTPGVNYTWSIVSGEQYATISDAGLLRSRGNATTQQTVQVKLTTTHTASGYSNEQTYNVQIRDYPATTVTAGIGDYNIINTVGGNLQLRGFLNGNYVASYTTYTIGGQSHNLSNGQDYGYNTPQVNGGFEYHWSLSGEGTAYATIANTLANNPQLTYTTDAGRDVVVEVNMYVTHPDFPELHVVATPFNVTLYSTSLAAPTISYNEGTHLVTLSTVSEGTTYYTTDGSDPRTSGTRIAYTAPFSVTTPKTIRASMERWGNRSSVSEETIHFQLGTPEITFSSSGVMTVTLANAPAGTTFRYTTDSSEPTTESTLYDNSNKPTIPNGTTVKVKAFSSTTGYDPSEVAVARYEISSGISGQTVTLNDAMDHSWTLFQPQINGETNPIYYANPKDVKITYKANGGAVSISESANQFVYYKTLTDDYKYTTIPNPFSKRPRNTSNQYQGFSKWKITRISGGTITGLSVNSEVNAETELTFNPTNEYGMEVDFEVVWTRAYVVTCAVGEVNANLNSNTLAGNSYETNFIVITSGTGGTGNTATSRTNLTADASKKVTITMVTPDGATDYRTGTRYINPQTITLSNDWKFEYINMNDRTTTITANNHNLVLGRGISNTTATGVVAGTVQGVNAATNNNLNYHIRMESGRYTNVDATMNANNNTSFGGTQTIRMTVGCDYDRANNNDNTKLYITSRFYGGNSVLFTNQANKSRETLRYTLKSGTFLTSTDMSKAENGQFYFGIAGWTRYSGRRVLVLEGGNVHSISGGLDYDGNDGANSYAGIVSSAYADTNTVMVEIQMRGGHVRGSIFGSAQFAAAKGKRKFVFTGGEVNGWVAGGCNGTNTTGGQTYGGTYIYVGGKAQIKQSNADPTINYSKGGNVFGAGSGNSGATGETATVGRVNHSTLVMADEAYVSRNVYGGGNYGFVMSETNNTAKTGSTRIYVTGGHVGGNVFGGSNNQQGQKIKIVMTGGQIDQGLFGGSNVTGTINQNVNLLVVGGQVGTESANGNVHGGGKGSATVVNGNVNVTIGGTTAKQPVIYGDVYGGSESGHVNGDGYNAGNTNTTSVTLNNGVINGSLYGGAWGKDQEAFVFGPVSVTVNGGTVTESVFGCNNAQGKPRMGVSVTINHTDPAPSERQYALKNVFGGGNRADYTAGTPIVTVNNCDNSIEYVYGGGNMATVPGTNVTIHGGNVIGNVFGGGYGANITTNGTHVTIDGGRILNVFGGSNNGGVITGSIVVDVNESNANQTACPIDIDNLYGGGNKAASAAGQLNIGCCSHIGNVYGGANQANITSNINLLITGGNIDNVFGGNNTSGNINGTITVTVDWEGSCTKSLRNVYGGGNKAAYSAPNSDGKNWPKVNIRNAVIEESVFGGGLGESALVTGNPQVTVSTQCPTQGHTNDHMVHIKGSLYGGGSAAPVTGNPVVNTRGLAGDAKKVQIDNYVFGGGFGQTAVVTGNTEVNIKGNTVVNKNVYGGGNGGLVTGNTNIVIGD